MVGAMLEEPSGCAVLAASPDTVAALAAALQTACEFLDTRRYG